MAWRCWILSVCVFCSPLCRLTSFLIVSLQQYSMYGARPLKRLIQRHVLNPLAVMVLDGRVKPGDTVKVELNRKGSGVSPIKTRQGQGLGGPMAGGEEEDVEAALLNEKEVLTLTPVPKMPTILDEEEAEIVAETTSSNDDGTSLPTSTESSSKSASRSTKKSKKN